jgi:hypothetical protein
MLSNTQISTLIGIGCALVTLGVAYTGYWLHSPLKFLDQVYDHNGNLVGYRYKHIPEEALRYTEPIPESLRLSMYT